MDYWGPTVPVKQHPMARSYYRRSQRRSLRRNRQTRRHHANQSERLQPFPALGQTELQHANDSRPFPQPAAPADGRVLLHRRHRTNHGIGNSAHQGPHQHEFRSTCRNRKPICGRFRCPSARLTRRRHARQFHAPSQHSRMDAAVHGIRYRCLRK